MKKNKNYVFVVIFYVFCTFFILNSCYSENTAYFQVNPLSEAEKFLKPPNTFSEKKQNLSVLGTGIEAFVYQSSLQLKDLIIFYKKKLTLPGFELADESQTGLLRYLYNKKQVLLINIAEVAAEKPYCLVTASILPSPELEAILEGTQPFSSDKDKTQQTVSQEDIYENISSLKEDMPGEDLAFIPRPRLSARVFSASTKDPVTVTLMYRCSQNLKDLAAFYKQNMAYYNWELTMEYPSENLEDQLESLPIPEGLPLDPTINLYFESNYGEATIVITDKIKEKMRLVNIYYKEFSSQE